MSRAFVKEDDGPSALPPLLGAALPEGTPNLATPWSARALHERLAAERAVRESLRDASDGVSVERRSRADAAIRALEPYVATLRVVDPPEPPVRAAFAVEVEIEGDPGRRVVAIVGVDEADPARGRVSFVSPLARALMGAVVGDVVTVATPRGAEEWEVTALRALRGP